MYKERAASQDVLDDHIREPEPARLPNELPSADEREATELQHQPARSRRGSRILIVPKQTKRRWYDPIVSFWMHHVRISVPHVDCRDHLGKSA